MGKQFWSDWLFPLLASLVFASLLATVLWPLEAISMSQVMSLSAGLTTIALLLVTTYMGTRPQFFVRCFGLKSLYDNRALMECVMAITLMVYVFFQWQEIQTLSQVTLAEWVALISLVLVIFSGVFSLSTVFVGRSRVMAFIQGKLNREVNLWMHRFAMLAIVSIYFHVALLPFFRENRPFMALLAVYSLYVLGYYAWWKIRIRQLPRYRVSALYSATPSLWVLEFEPKYPDQFQEYMPGDVFFIRFKGQAEITPEAHPFAVASALSDEFSSQIQFFVEEVGDWTQSIKDIRIGDEASLEGPYGSFLAKDLDNSVESAHPYILLALGAGIGPCLSVIRHEMDKGSQREIRLIWCLAPGEAMFLSQDLAAAEARLAHFHVQQIDFEEDLEDALAEGLARELEARHYQAAYFFISGPGDRVQSSQKVLAALKLPQDRLSILEFNV